MFKALSFALVLWAPNIFAEAIDYPEDPFEIADAVVVYTPKANMALHKIKSFEREIVGHIKQQDKGVVAPGLIVHRANTLIRPLEMNKPVRMYLKRFPDRDAYYPIAIFPVNYKGEK